MKMTPPALTRRRLRKFGLWLLYILLLQEILVRAVFPVPDVLNFDRIDYSPSFVGADAGKCTSLAHASFRWVSGPDGAESVQHLSLYGFRDRTWSRNPRGRARRIAVVGDSMVEGFLAGEDETIPAVIREALNGAGEEVETMNLGIGGASLHEYFQVIRDAVPLFRPEHVILVLYENDFHDIEFDPDWLKEHMTPRRSSFWLPRLKYVIRSLRKHGFAPSRWHSKPFDFLPPVGDPRHPWSDPAHARWAEDIVASPIAEAIRSGEFNPFGIRYMERLEFSLVREYEFRPHLRALSEFLGRHEAKLWVVYLPTLLQVSDRYADAQRQLSESETASFLSERFLVQAKGLETQCMGLALPFLDLTMRLRKLEGEGVSLYWPYDGHMNPKGYRAAGEAIARWWMENR
ncbi:MAG: SGNH/GDSL hydrolase family protein [Planctomycetota bacterium]|jgi:lysophospholipase L1-like esterase